MLTSTQIYLRALAPGELPNTTGQFGHAAFLRLMETVSPELSTALHGNNGRQPFTVSPLQVPARARVNGRTGAGLDSLRAGNVRQHLRLSEGAGCSMRFTMLDPRLYAAFQNAFLVPWQEAVIRLGHIPFAVYEVVTTPRADGLTGFTSFVELWDGAGMERTLTLRFVSPTALSRGDGGKGKIFDLLPTAWGVFDSLCRKWNAFAEQPIVEPNGLREWIEKNVVVADVRELTTTTLRFEKFAQKGFVGTVTYMLLGEDESMIRGMNALADFALYAAVGYKTTMGMGQARRILDFRF